MLNSESDAPDDAVDTIAQSGMPGAVVVAGIATAVVIGLWFAFYIFVFVPRGPVP
jgi:hypothetical protein